jgi:hypothetical protein
MMLKHLLIFLSFLPRMAGIRADATKPSTRRGVAPISGRAAASFLPGQNPTNPRAITALIDWIACLHGRTLQRGLPETNDIATMARVWNTQSSATLTPALQFCQAGEILAAVRLGDVHQRCITS